MTYFEALLLAPPRLVVASALTPIHSLARSLSLSLYIALLQKLLPGPKTRPRKELQHRHIQLLRSLTRLGHNFFLEFLPDIRYNPRIKFHPESSESTHDMLSEWDILLRREDGGSTKTMQRRKQRERQRNN